MTETQPENFSQKPKLGISSKLRPTAKEFVFNTAAPVWTPSRIPVTSSPLHPNGILHEVSSPPVPMKSQLKLSAKPFIPSYHAPTFVPASLKIPVVEKKNIKMKTLVTGDMTRTIMTDSSSSSTTSTTTTTMSTTTTTPAATTFVDDEQMKTSTLETNWTPATSVASSSSSESEQEEHNHIVKEEKVIDVEIQTEMSEREEMHKQHKVDTPTKAQFIDEERKESEKPEVVAEQAVISERIMYTIKQLLEMELDVEMCPMPECIKSSIIASEITTKALSASMPDALGTGLRRNDSFRSLGRHNSSGSFNDGRGRRDGRGSSRGGRSGRGGRSHQDTAPPLEDCAPLDINEETRWKPSHAKSRLDDPVETTVASLKEAKAILNKLSIEKFDKLSDQLIEVAVRGLEVLKGVIEMVIAKAQNEWHFSTMYAELCAKIAQTAMPAITLEDNEVVTDTHKLFRKLLLLRCQKEFETKRDVEDLENLREDERREKELIIKRASLGHIRFVGELFKQRMLRSRIMHECVGILFGDITAPDEESLECLCNLLSTIGQAFESNVSAKAELNRINGYYAIIKKLSGESKLLCTRVRFMLQDLLELRSNRWVARRKETKAMTIAEVHEEVAREAKEKERTNSKGGGQTRLQRSYSMNSTGSVSSNDRRRGSGGGASAAWKARAVSTSSSASTSTAPVVDADGWETVTGGARPKSMKHRSNSDRLFPPTLSGAPRHPSDHLIGNAFASLSGKENGRKERARSNSSSSTSSRSLRGREDGGRPPTSLSSMASSNSRSTKSAKATKVEATLSLTAEVFEKKVKAILDEYVELEDLEEAYTSFTELNASNYYGLIPTKVLNIGLDKGDKEREAIASFLAGLYDRKVVTGAALGSAVQQMLEFAEDIEIDIPKTLPYLSMMVAPSVVAGSITIPQLVSMSEHLCYNGKAAKLIGSTLEAIISCEDEIKVQELLASDSVDFMALLAEKNRNDEAVRAFYKDYSLEFLI
ncbi:unnamed protein product [Peronospora belbahrii]|uniref:MI domain-containing protein n=1 Tax=Peronospora belbahrii TaxID=622444 RepID=A0AAU9LHS3_9STRA|nr:unnamed protein product [Peronospora belbahrii]CAH0521493.1 unnamed protein product [Peronospora belbahrii]